MKMQGFSLIESMIYVILSSLLIMLASTFLFESWYSVNNSHDSLLAGLNHFEVYQLLSDDCASAYPDPALWDISEKSHLIMQSGTQDVGWGWQENTLFRSAGNYNFAKRFWISKETARILEDVTDVTCKRIRRESYTSIQFSYKHKGKKQEYVLPIQEAYEYTE